MASVYREFDRQPPIVKGVVVIGIGLLGWSIYNSIKKKQDEKDATQAAQQAKKELEVLKSQGAGPTYSESQFLNWSDRLVQAMTGCGTDEDTIFSIFNSMRNEADVRQLIVSFGLRYYQPCAATSPVSYAIWQFNDEAYGGELGTWLGYDLSDSDIANINAILHSKGIAYQF